MSLSRRQPLVLVGPLLVLLTLGACASQKQPAESVPTPVHAEQLPSQSAPPATSADGRSLPDLSGRTIAIDPGHNGKNAKNPGEISRQVPDGRGGTKPCNTTGTATDSDFSEAEFAWQVATALRTDLEAAGAEVVLSREDNDGVGPCVDERGKFAADADLLVSIHANGSETTKTKGFHIIVAKPAMSKKLDKPSSSLAESMSEAMTKDFEPNNAYGKKAISRRDDLAGLNNSPVPAVIVECGEMRNPTEAKVMESREGQRRYAGALLRGIADWYSSPEAQSR